MATQDTHTDPLSRESQYSGMIYWINTPSGLTLNLENLRDHLDDRVFSEDITDQIDSSTEVPEVFKNDGKIIRRTSVSGAKTILSNPGEIIWAKVRMDNSSTISYRGNDILTMNASAAEILIFEYQETFYFIVVSRREVAEAVADMIRRKYNELGELVNGTRLSDHSLQKIRKDLNANLMDTILSEFPDEDLTNVAYSGSSFENRSDYTDHQEKGVTQNYMFQTDQLVADSHKTIRIANDGLVRIYNKSRLETYLNLLSQYILPRIHRDNTGDATLDTFDRSGDHPIFVEEDI